jgi:CheY-like chemotaxis protein
MNLNHILIVEDKPEELNVAREIAKVKGIDTRVAINFKSALEELKFPGLKAVASDLFFPAGDIDQGSYISQILPSYESYLNSFRKITDGPLIKTLNFVFAERGNMTKEQFFEEIMTKTFLKDWDEEGKRQVADAYFGIEFYHNYSKLQKHIEEIKQGRGMPYGIFLTKEAGKLQLPAYVVTSTNHHDVAFQPVRKLLTTDYRDDLVDGHKDWARAFDYLSQKIKSGAI